MSARDQKNTAVCLSCQQVIKVGDHPKFGQIIVCKYCDTELEIIDLNPVVLDWPYYEDDYAYEDSDYDTYENY